jgi:hypothetical protein
MAEATGWVLRVADADPEYFATHEEAMQRLDEHAAEEAAAGACEYWFLFETMDRDTRIESMGTPYLLQPLQEALNDLERLI